jgi:hypothetical protein
MARFSIPQEPRILRQGHQVKDLSQLVEFLLAEPAIAPFKRQLQRVEPKSRRGRTETTVTLCICEYSFVMVSQKKSRWNILATGFRWLLVKRSKLMVAEAGGPCSILLYRGLPAASRCCAVAPPGAIAAGCSTAGLNVEALRSMCFIVKRRFTGLFVSF